MRPTHICLLLLGACAGIVFSCSKGGDDGPSDPCSNITVVVSGNSTNPSTSGGTNGSITASASGGTGFTYSLNGGSFQSSGNFSNLAAGTYTVTARNSEGCTGTRQFTLTNPSPTCTGVTITVTANATAATPCATPAAGSISASASGSTGFTFSIDGASFQASGNFSNLAPGNYTVTAKDANGCTGSANVTVGSAPAGPLFTAVRTLMDNNCVSCHNNSIQNGGMNWAVDCNIVLNKDRVKARAVDNNPSSMPPTGALSQTDKDKITAWINAGGRYTD
ncbi:MAG: SprB repeat-containing protein [Chitinophagaceae bacterium]